ncbi:hypothetical protein WMY93_033854 [Mugilogobius chulae]|uniref:Uncharacterized protein n=1 Tax=Mugilogobius chulae TaxID=88201 RepID=A0AAW0MM96_9GOBI
MSSVQSCCCVTLNTNSRRPRASYLQLQTQQHVTDTDLRPDLRPQTGVTAELRPPFGVNEGVIVRSRLWSRVFEKVFHTNTTPSRCRRKVAAAEEKVKFAPGKKKSKFETLMTKEEIEEEQRSVPRPLYLHLAPPPQTHLHCTPQSMMGNLPEPLTLIKFYHRRKKQLCSDQM